MSIGKALAGDACSASPASRCTGHCCRSFTLDLDLLTDPKRKVADGDQLRAMVLPIEQREDAGAGFWSCTCVHFDGANCTIYEDRPLMCREYPYREKCKHDGCTFVRGDGEGVRAGKPASKVGGCPA